MGQALEILDVLQVLYGVLAQIKFCQLAAMLKIPQRFDFV
jgi:hypothetical protein